MKWKRQYRTGALAGKARTEVTAFCGKIEAELAELPAADALEYLTSYGLKESACSALSKRLTGFWV